jgi:hypothetical protein
MPAARSGASVWTWVVLAIVVGIVPTGIGRSADRSPAAPTLSEALDAPALSIATTPQPGDTAVALEAVWSVGVCDLTPGWYRWSLPSPGPIAYLNGTDGSNSWLEGAGNTSGTVPVRVQAAATLACGGEMGPVVAEANASVYVAGPLVVGPLTLTPALAGVGASIRLATNLSGVAPFAVTVAWGDGTSTRTVVPNAGPVDFDHAYPAAGRFLPTLFVRDGENRADTATPPAPAVVASGPALTLVTADPVDEVGVAVPFSVVSQDLPSSVRFADLCGGPGAQGIATSANGGNFTCSFEAPGAYAVQVLALGDPSADVFGTFAEDVQPPAQLVGPTTPLQGDVGQALPVPVTLSGGVPPFRVNVSGPGLSAPLSVELVCDGPVEIPVVLAPIGASDLSVELSDAEEAPAASISVAVDLGSGPNVTAYVTNASASDGMSIDLWGGVVGGVPPFDVVIAPTAPALSAPTYAWTSGGDATFAWNATFAAEGTTSIEVEVFDAFGLMAEDVVGVPLVPPLQIAAAVVPTPDPSANLTNVTVTLAIAGGLPPFTVSVTSTAGNGTNGSVPRAGSSTWNLTLPDVGPVSLSISVVDSLGVNRTLLHPLDAAPPPSPAPGPRPGPNGTAPTAAETASAANAAIWGAVGIVALGAVGSVLWVLQRKRRSRRAAPAPPDPVAVLRGLIEPVDGADRGTIELLAEEAGVPMETVTATIDRLIADGRLRAERSEEGEESLTWFGGPHT